MKEAPKYNMVDSMFAGGISKGSAERRLAEMALGVIKALRESAISPDDAYNDLFNLDVYQAIKKHRLSADLKELFAWGMELEDVAEIAPSGLTKSYAAIEKMARGILDKSAAAKIEQLKKNPYPAGWNARRVRRVVEHAEKEIAALKR